MTKRALVAIVLVTCAFTAVALAQPHAHPVAFTGNALSCGVERWPAKTLADPGSAHVRFAPRATTIAKLRRLRVTVGFGGVRGAGAEQTTFRVRARLVELKEEADSDFHLVLADPQSGVTMIAEFPNKSCTHGATAHARTLMQRARVALVAACGFPSNNAYRRVAGTATVTGVAFFDRVHGQAGVAPNGIELHPVLKFSGSCH